MNTSVAPQASPAAASTTRRLLRQSWRATLATNLQDEQGEWPYASLVLTACDTDIRPLLFISNLAVHTKNLMRDPRASILFDGTGGLSNPLTGSRVTVLGTMAPVEDERAVDRYVRRQPSAAFYRSFGDFRLWRLEPDKGQLVAGFGKIEWVGRAQMMAAPAAVASIANAEPELLEALNGTPLVEAVGRRQTELSGWSLTGVDPDGADLRNVDDETARVEFEAPASDGEDVRRALEALAG